LTCQPHHHVVEVLDPAADHLTGPQLDRHVHLAVAQRLQVERLLSRPIRGWSLASLRRHAVDCTASDTNQSERSAIAVVSSPGAQLVLRLQRRIFHPYLDVPQPILVATLLWSVVTQRVLGA